MLLLILIYNNPWRPLIKIIILYIFIQRHIHDLYTSPFFPPSPSTNLNQVLPLRALHSFFYAFHKPLQNHCHFLNVIYVYDRRACLHYNIDTSSYTESLSKCASRHFQKFFQKFFEFHRGARTSTPGVVVNRLSGFDVVDAVKCHVQNVTFKHLRVSKSQRSKKVGINPS